MGEILHGSGKTNVASMRQRAGSARDVTATERFWRLNYLVNRTEAII